MLKSILFCLFISLFFLVQIAEAQEYTVKGVVIDSIQKTGLPGSNIVILQRTDSTVVTGNVSNLTGAYIISNVKPGKYLIKISYLGYETYFRKFRIVESDMNLGVTKLKPSQENLEVVTIDAMQERGTQKGDTSEFNAGAFKTNPDATAEDLVKKLPGVTTDGNTIKVNGEEVKKVMVDGKQFFGDDPTASLRNLPAEIVNKVQIYDRGSEQSMFTGFSDGNEEKTLNIITKEGKNQGVFGKVYGGLGLNDYYNSGLSLNYFNGNRRISVLGMSNNINQQNFNISDIMGVMSNAGISTGMGRGGMSAMSNFFSGFQDGNSKTHSFGVNYIDSWGKNIKVTGSYFANTSNNQRYSDLVRTYFIDSIPQYSEVSTSQNINTNHRFNFRFEWELDSLNSIIITPQLTFQNNDASSLVVFNNLDLITDQIVNGSVTNAKSLNLGYNFGNDILFQHKFLKKGRTVSLNINSQLNRYSGSGLYFSETYFADILKDSLLLDQNYTSLSNSMTYGGTLSYTEPVGKNSQLMLSYYSNNTFNLSEKLTYNVEPIGLIQNANLSNQLDYSYLTNNGGISYRFNNKKIIFNTGLDFKHTQLNGNQKFPYESEVIKTFANILPTANLNYRFSKTSNLNFRYETRTNLPSVSQLQDVLNISNPLFVKTGNMDLSQSYQHSFRSRFGISNKDKTKNFHLYANGSYTNDYISSATYFITNDTVVQGFAMSKGSQLSKPINIDGQISIRSFGFYSFPVNFIKSTINLNAGYVYSKNPALINNQINFSKSNVVNSGIYISSNIGEYLDFSVSYSNSFNNVNNSNADIANNQYINQNASLKVNYILFKKLVLNTDIRQVIYTGLNDGFNSNFTLWNAFIGYKFLKNNALEVRLSINDILNQNQTIGRNTTETYIEDSYTEILKRYGMLTITYNIRKFSNNGSSSTTPNVENQTPPPSEIRPPGGMRPPDMQPHR